MSDCGTGMVILLMGVAGAGKTTVGRELAAALRWRFYDGDDFHLPANIRKMTGGMPLTDDDRRPWLASLHAAIDTWIKQGEHVVLAASVLKADYRATVLAGHEPRVRLVYLNASTTLLQQRLASRAGHFMGATLLKSQLDILEEPSDALMLDASEPSPVLVERIRAAFAL